MNIVNEVWQDINGYEGFYQVSSLGRVRSCDRSFVDKKGVTQHHKGQVLKFSSIKGKYFIANLRGKVLYVHRIVAEVFCQGNFDGAHVNHKNGIKTDNRAENLEWCTQSENNQHAFKTGLIDNRGMNCGGCKLTESQVIEIRNLCAKGVSSKTLAKNFKTSYSNIRHIVCGETWGHLL
jgi:transcriptional regulator